VSGGVACAAQSAATTNTAHIAVLAITAAGSFEAMVLVNKTALMALADWLAVVGIVVERSLYRRRRALDWMTKRGQVLTKDGVVGGCVVCGETVVCGGSGREVAEIEFEVSVYQRERGVEGPLARVRRSRVPWLVTAATALL
jgi:hypothetical protein